MTVLKVPATWEDSKKQLGDASFMERLLKFDKDALDDLLLRKIGKFTQNPEFTPEVRAPGRLQRSPCSNECLGVNFQSMTLPQSVMRKIKSNATVVCPHQIRTMYFKMSDSLSCSKPLRICLYYIFLTHEHACECHEDHTGC